MFEIKILKLHVLIFFFFFNFVLQIVKMMIVIIIIFAVCWLPYHIYFLLIHHFPDFMTVPYVQHVYFVIYWLAMSNSMYNPLIYCWMNKKYNFKHKIQKEMTLNDNAKLANYFLLFTFFVFLMFILNKKLISFHFKLVQNIIKAYVATY